MSTAVYDVLEDWKIKNHVASMSFDTTSPNKVIRKSACVRLEKLRGKDLLYLACRHHVFELILKAVFNLCF